MNAGGVGINIVDFDIVLNECELKSNYYIHFHENV